MRDRILHRLKLSDLRLLRTVVEFGGMAKAAAHLNISQPAVSKAITALERTVGLRLVDRTPRGIVPTAYGKVLLTGAVAVFDELRQSLNQIENLTDSSVGELRFGTIEFLITSFVPAVIDRMSRSHPGINFHVEELNLARTQYRELRERNVEFVITRIHQTPTEPDLEVEPLFNDPIFAGVGINSPWFKRRRIRLSELSNEPWSYPPVDGVVGPLIVNAFREQGLEPPKGVACSNMQMHKALLATGRYVAILPTSLLRFGTEQRTIKRLPLVLSKAPAPVGIITLKNRTIHPLAKVFIDIARDLIKKTPPISNEGAANYNVG
jgi:DNA-binding transcriptional LysR family regulator